LNKNFEIINEMLIGDYIEEIQLYKNYLIAIDTGLQKPKKDLWKINLLDKSKVKFELPRRPHRIIIKDNIAYISSSEEDIYKKGFF